MKSEPYSLVKSLHIAGGLNTNDLVVNSEGKYLLRRTPRQPGESDTTYSEIMEEYIGLGFFSAGGKCALRSPREQVVFTQQAAEAGLSVLLPADYDDPAIYYPFLEDSKTLDQYLAEEINAGSVLMKVFQDLRLAHKQGIVYGDRWTKNILVQSAYKFVNIDFDLLIRGDCAKEFEVAQVVYYSVIAGRSSNIPMIVANLAISARDLKAEQTKSFLRRHAAFFRETEFCDRGNYIEHLLSVMEKI